MNDNGHEEISQEELDAWEREFYEATIQEMEKAEKSVPEKDMQPVKEAAMDMTEKMSGYRQMEQDSGHSQPEVWHEHAKKQEEINKNLEDCRKAYEQEKPQEVKQTAIEKAKDSFEEAGKAFSEQMKKLSQMYAKELEAQREENRRMQEKLQEMERIVKELCEASRPVIAHEHSYDNTKAGANPTRSVMTQDQSKTGPRLQITTRPLASAEQILAVAEAMRILEEIAKKNQAHRSKDVRSSVSHTVQDTYHAIVDAPRRVRNAIKAKAYHAVEGVLSKVTARLNEASRKIEENRQRAEKNEQIALSKAKATPARWRRVLQPQKQDEKEDVQTKEKPKRKRVVAMRKSSKSHDMER